MKVLNRWLVAAVATVMTTAMAVAQTNHVAWSKIETGSWTFNPIYTQTAETGPSVVSFLALADPAALSGDNIVAVWYQRDAGGWTAKSWETSDPWEAIKSVKLALGVADEEDERWGVPGSDDDLAAVEEPKDYTVGVLAEDPLAPLIVGSPDRAALVEFLTSIGYKAADVPVDKDDGCTTNAKLDGMAADAAAMVADGDETILSLSSQASLCDVFAGPPRGPRPTKPAKPANPPAWSPPGTVPTAPAWTPGTWPVAPGWRCRTVSIGGGGTNCICTRIRYWGRWETTTCGIWPFRYTCTRWHEIVETETCTDINVTCPPGGPPGGTMSNCNSTY